MEKSSGPSFRTSKGYLRLTAPFDECIRARIVGLSAFDAKKQAICCASY